MPKEDINARHLLRLAEITDEGPEQNWFHNWMYSFMYGDHIQYDTALSSKLIDGIYLVAFCKNCRKGLTVLLDRSFSTGQTVLTDLDVPKYGCVAPA